MPYNLKEWNQRISNRTDLSSYVSHLTRGADDQHTGQILMKILMDQKIIGSKIGPPGYIVGKNPAVCFQDIPFVSLGQNVLHEINYRKQQEADGIPKEKIKKRYSPAGIAFKKNYVFNHGGRPVIYENTEYAKKILPEEEHWRIVNFDLSRNENIVDWTHEREWRVKGDFEFDLSEVVLIVNNQTGYKWLIDNDKEGIINKLSGIVMIEAVLF